MSFSNYLEDKVLNHVFGGSAYTAPTTLYIALLTSAPDDTSTGVSGQSNSIAEVSGSGTGYTRKSATFTVSGTAPTQASNSAELNWSATGSWGTVSHVAVLDSGTIGQGNVLAYTNLQDASGNARTVSVLNGDTFRISASALNVRLD